MYESVSNKTIAFTSNTSWYLYNFQLNNMQNFMDRDYSVVAISPIDKYSAKLEKCGIKHIDIKMDNHGVNPLSDFKVIEQYLTLYKKIQPQVVCSFTIKPNIYSTIVAAKLGIKVINNISGLGTVFVRTSLLSKLVILLYRYAMRGSNHIFFQNQDNRDLFLRQVNIKNYSLIPGSGVDTEQFCSIEKQQSTVVKFILVARLLWKKGIQEYVDAAQLVKDKHPSTCFYLLGEGVDGKLGVTKQQVQDWHSAGHINYRGFTDNVKQEIAEVDCVVLPSYYADGTPKSLLEAASMSKPIITTDTSGCRNVVEQGITGYLCKSRSAEDLANKMLKFMALTEQEKIKMGRAGRAKIIKEYSVEKVVQKYQQVVDKVLND